MINVAINGFGRIGRTILRTIYENGYQDQIRVVAISDLADATACAHLLKYDTVHGTFNQDIDSGDSQLKINGDSIWVINGGKLESEALLPWGDMNVDLVFECTGRLTLGECAAAHLIAGAKKVLVSAPGTKMDATVVYGVNHECLTADMQIVSNASCTTNCLAPMAQTLNDAVGIVSGLMTTVHAVTGDQSLADGGHSDPYRARAAMQSMIPTKTGAARAVGEVLPELDGRIDGMAVRVPTPNVSLVDLTFVPNMASVSVEDINNALMAGAAASPVMVCNDKPLVSVDFNGNPASCVVDLTQTRVIKNGNDYLVKVMAWYDNEVGFANRMVDTALYWLSR